MGEIKELIYVEKKEYIKTSLILLIVGIGLIGIESISVISLIYEISYLISGIVILMLIFLGDGIGYERFFKENIWLFSSIVICNLYRIILSDNVVNTKFYLMAQKTYVWQMLSVAVGIGFIIDFINKRKNLKLNLLKIGGVFLIGSSYLMIEESRVYSSIIFICILVYVFLSIKKINKKIEGKVNTLKVYLIALIIKAIGLTIYTYVEISIVEMFIIGNILFVLMGSYTWNIIRKLIKAPFYKEENNLDCLRADIVNLDKKLEFNKLRRTNEKENRANNLKLFKSFFQNIPVPIITVNEDGNICYINKQARDLMGIKSLKEALFNKSKIFIEYYGVNLEEKIGRSIECSIKTNKKIVNIDVRQGIERNGEIILVLTDLTDKIKHEELENKLLEKKTQEQLKRKFLGNISHDLKTPVNVIYSSAQVQDIFIENENEEGIEKQLDVMKRNCLALKRLTNNIIDIGRIDSGFLEKTVELLNIVTFAEEIVSSLVDYSKMKGIDLIFDTTCEDIYMKFNKSYMERVILNLITNAIKYNKVNGVVVLRIDVILNKVEISVNDTGIGIKKEFIKRVFDRYFKDGKTLSGEFKSSGIGLYVVKNLVEAQGGVIEIESEYGQGTVVKMVFDRENIINEE